MADSDGQWSSKLGFILAASGSAIGLGNIVFFSGNAYKYGAGAFYVPYLLALFLVGIPVLLLELGLGGWSRRSFPGAMHAIGDRPAEFFGWWGLFSATFIAMYYITILGWVLGMWIAALGGDLWQASVAVPAFGLAEGDLANPIAVFFAMLSSWRNLLYVVAVWMLNLLIVRRGAKGIEAAVRIFVPAMWLFMIALIVRGLTLPGGVHGAYLLFTPQIEAMADPAVWRGAFAQIFFTLSLGFGIMTTYASYLPRQSDQAASALTIAGLNCAFEFIAGLAIFTMLFAFALVPSESTIAMIFFVVPSGIASFPVGAKVFGVAFFTLLLVAGLSSSVSLVEAFAGAIVDKYGHRGLSRDRAMLFIAGVGTLGSLAFAWPTVVDPALEGDGTLGFTLLDLVDHWAFSYGLLITGLIECLAVGWWLGPERLRGFLNAYGLVKVGRWFDISVRYVIPIILLVLLGTGLAGEIRDGLYGTSLAGAGSGLAWTALAFWAISTVLLAGLLTGAGEYPAFVEEEA